MHIQAPFAIVGLLELRTDRLSDPRVDQYSAVLCIFWDLSLIYEDGIAVIADAEICIFLQGMIGTLKEVSFRSKCGSGMPNSHNLRGFRICNDYHELLRL